MEKLPDTYTFRWGEGHISGFGSAACGALSLLGTLCFLYPDVLSFPDLQKNYSPYWLRLLLLAGLISTFVLGLINFLIGRWRALGYSGMFSASVALLIGGFQAGSDEVHQASVITFGVDWFILDVLVSALIFIPLERLWALRREQPILRREWRLDLQYFAMSHVLVSSIILASTTTVTYLCTWAIDLRVQQVVRELPLWVQLPLILVVADLAQYWSHRLMHTVPWLWRIHAVHHSSRDMDWLASSRLHLGEIVITRTCVLAPIFILGFSPQAILLYVVYIGLHAIFIHANVRFTFGPLRHLLVTPAFHHWHHSDDPRAANTNFAVHLPILDRLFGTWYSPREWPTTYGIGEEQLPAGIFNQFMYPFRK